MKSYKGKFYSTSANLNFKSIWSVIVLLCLIALPSYAYKTNLQILTKEDGLGNNSIYCIHKDKDGFVWVGTDIGITKYDGKWFRRFRGREAVQAIQEDSNGYLWLKGSLDSLYCFDRFGEETIPVVRTQTEFSARTTCFFVNGDQLYFSTPTEVLRFQIEPSLSNNKLSVILQGGDNALAEGPARSIISNGNGLVYILQENGTLLQYHEQTGTSKAIFIKEIEALDDQQRITRILFCNGYLWLLDAKNGLVCYDPKTATSRRIAMAGHSVVGVSDIKAINQTSYYLATPSGLCTLIFDNKSFNSPYQIEYVEGSSPFYEPMIERKSTALYWDSQLKQLWVATFGGGIVKYDMNDIIQNQIFINAEIQINQIAEDEKGYIWLSTNNNGIMKSVQNVLSKDVTFASWPNAGKSNQGYRMYKDKSGHLWFGDDAGEIIYVNPLTEESAAYKLQPDGILDFSAQINNFCLDSRNRLWIATSKGLLLFDRLANKCNRYTPDLTEYISSVTEDKGGEIWVGTANGLMRVDQTKDQPTFVSGIEKSIELAPSMVYSLYVNSYNQLLASYADKVIRMDGRKKDVVDMVFTAKDGLTSGHVYCMIDDKGGNTWLGGNSGIMTMNNNGNSFYNYYRVGNHKAVCQLKNGSLLWVNSWGILFYDPLLAKLDPDRNRIYLSSINLNHKTVTSRSKIAGQQRLTIEPNGVDQFVMKETDYATFYFTNLQYSSQSVRVKYRLLPQNEQWETYTLGEGIYFEKLYPGEYTLELKTILPDDSEPPVKQIKIVVLTHWAKSWWAIILYLLLILCIGLSARYYFKRRIQLKESLLANENKLHEKLERVKSEHEQKLEMNMLRNQLLSLIALELRTPLSLIVAPLREILCSSSLPQALVARVNLAYRNTLGMQDTCDLLLDIYNEDKYIERLQISECDILEVVGHVIDLNNELIRANQIDFQYNRVRKNKMMLWIDRPKIEFVVRNLLSNAFRRISYSGIVRFDIKEDVITGAPCCIITISEEGKERIVEDEKNTSTKNDAVNFSQIELGIEILEKILEAHGGKIIRNESWGNNVISLSVCILLGKKHFEGKDNITFVANDIDVKSMPETTSSVAGSEAVPVELPEDNVLNMDEVLAPIEEKGGKKKILVVEDNRDIRTYLRVIFSPLYTVVLAQNGQEGVDMALQELPDLVLCDVMMPVKDGFECCKEIKENLKTCHIPVIMLTAKTEDEDILKGTQMGAEDYLLKPFNPEILKAKVSNLIRSRVYLKQTYMKLLMVPNEETANESVEQQLSEEDKFINAVVKIIEENIQESDFSVKKLAESMNMSQPTLYRKVKMYTDFTIVELIRGVRLKRAAVLLKKQQYAVQEVVEMVGYNDIPTFRKHFVDFFGMTPSNYAASANKAPGNSSVN